MKTNPESAELQGPFWSWYESCSMIAAIHREYPLQRRRRDIRRAPNALADAASATARYHDLACQVTWLEAHGMCAAAERRTMTSILTGEPELCSPLEVY